MKHERQKVSSASSKNLNLKFSEINADDLTRTWYCKKQSKVISVPGSKYEMFNLVYCKCHSFLFVVAGTGSGDR